MIVPFSPTAYRSFPFSAFLSTFSGFLSAFFGFWRAFFAFLSTFPVFSSSLSAPLAYAFRMLRMRFSRVLQVA